MCEMDMGHFANLNLSVADVRCWYLGYVVLDRTSTCLLTAMAAVQAADARASFLFVADLNGHHQEWLGSTTTNRNGVAALDFATVQVVINW